MQDSSFSFDALDNLTYRSWWDGAATRSETFGYDTLNRLTTVTGTNGPVAKTYAYYPNGNIQSKTGVGTYTYPTNGIRPHAVTSTLLGATTTSYGYDANGNMLTGNGRTITYTAFNKPMTIAGASGTTTLTYDANYNRLLKVAPGGTTTYLGKLYEKIVSGTTTTQKHYLYAGSNLVGAHSSLSNNTSNTRYFHTDHLGSIEAITNETGGVVQRLSYDAHGKRRNVNGTDATGITAQTTRGFTRHEHDDEVGLVNMNAREYDPVLGRFITPDTIIPGAMNSQSYNRYSYVNNNPLSYTDPTGHGLRKWFKKTVKKYGRSIVAVGAAFFGAPMLAHGLMGGGIVAHGIAAGAIMGQVMGGNTESTLRGGFFGGVTGGVTGYYAPSALGNNLGGSNGIALGSAKFAGHHIINAEIRNEVGQYAARQGYSLTEFNLGLFGFSVLGNVTVGSRFQAPTDKGNYFTTSAFGVSGFFTRGGGSIAGNIAGLPFDVADTVLALQGIPTASAIDAFRGASAYGLPLTGHSLGALDVANLGGLGLLSHTGQSYAAGVPFGKVVVGAQPVIGVLDPITGYGASGILNPDAWFYWGSHPCTSPGTCSSH